MYFLGSVGFGGVVVVVIIVTSSYAFLALDLSYIFKWVLRVSDFLQRTLPWNNSVQLTVIGQNIQISVRACLDV
jgi:hypothetical protein